VLLLGLALAGAAPACGSDEQGSAPSTGGGHAGVGAGGEAGLLSGGGRASEAGMSAEGGADAGAGGHAGAAAGAAGWAPPTLLSEMGLYRDLTEDETLADGLVEYQPRFELWSDGALKRRFLRIPAGERIDTSDLDHWMFPAGTQAFKEFWRDGVRLETRVLQKLQDGSWFAMAYAWNAAQTDAEAVPSGVPNALGTEHDIPNQVMCGECHDEMPDRLLGVGALQLSHDLGGFALGDLIAEERLSHPPAQPLELPGDEAAHAALGYLHANCGNCHNPRARVYSTVQLDLWLLAESLTTVETTTTYQSTVGVAFQGVPPTPDTPALRISPGYPEDSALYFRMSQREPLVQMPPLGTEAVDEDGQAQLAAWIATL
jgi:hypothetical protein